MWSVCNSGLAAVVCMALVGCSSPYNSLITPQLISVVEQEQTTPHSKISTFASIQPFRHTDHILADTD